MDFKNFVIKTEEFINCDIKSSKHIAFTVTENYVQYAGIVMTTALLTGTGKFSVHFFSTDFFKNDIEKIKLTAEKYQCNAFLHYVDDSSLKLCNDPGEFSYASYYRLIIPECLAQYTDKVFYSDVDVCILKDISPLWNIDMTDECACVVEIQGKRHRNEAKRIGVNRYFVSGGFLINIPNWIKMNVAEKCFNMASDKNKKYRYPDMDILNIVLENKVKFIDGKYQYQYSISHTIDNVDRPTQVKVPEDTVILHYTGSVKPWHKLAERFEIAKFFCGGVKTSLWKRIDVIEPKSYKEYHKFARLAKKEGNFWDILYWYYKYAFSKINYLIHRI